MTLSDAMYIISRATTQADMDHRAIWLYTVGNIDGETFDRAWEILDALPL